MNYLQFGLFFIYVFSTLLCGAGIYNFIDKGRKSIINRSIYLGEVFLLGSILLVGEMLFLSLIGLYKAPYLWAVVLANFILLFNKDIRGGISYLWSKKIADVFPTSIFIILLVIFFFRNCYFLFDTDSCSTYLFAQKLWLSAGSSLTGGIGSDVRIFAPQFNAVPYSLGLSLFGNETLFPQLVNLFWRLIVLFLVFGYTRYRFNGYYGLAAAMFVLLNEHFFYSGINKAVIINGAVIAFIFAAAYNFWESRTQKNDFRFLLALVFLSQIIANKYQAAGVLFFLTVMGFFAQFNPVKQIKEILYNRKWRGILLGALFILSLWFIKNFLLTGDPLFPAFAGKLGVFNWNPELEKVILKTSSSLTAAKFFKYMNFFFIWPGINAAKYVILTIAFFPLIIFRYSMKSEIDKSLIFELSFWLGVSLLTVMGICFVAWQDPRAYRYLIGVLSFTAVFSIHFILRYVFNIRKKILLCSVMLILPLMAGANEGYKIIYQAGGGLEVPALRDNIDVILNIAHTDLVIKKHYPNVASILNVINENEGKMAKSAWDINSFDLNFPAFFLPVRPVVSLWASTIIKWDSYSSDSLIVNDLRSFGIEWIMEMREGKLVFLPIEEYAREAARYERYPKTTSFDYGFPEELTRVVY